jgi:hypothetical protein
MTARPISTLATDIPAIAPPARRRVENEPVGVGDVVAGVVAGVVAAGAGAADAVEFVSGAGVAVAPAEDVELANTLKPLTCIAKMTEVPRASFTDPVFGAASETVEVVSFHTLPPGGEVWKEITWPLVREE